jgi:hypothetical protein
MPRICVLVALASGLLAAHAAAAEDPRKREPKGWDVTLSPPGEPGEPFEMSGEVYSGGGQLMRNAKVFVYHADARGEYARGKDDPVRLAAMLRTDSAGHYRIRSVFPGSYGYAAHVHFEYFEHPGRTEAGFVNVRRQGQQAPQGNLGVPVMRAADGVWRLTWNLRPGNSGPTSPPAKPPELRYPPPKIPGLWPPKPAAKDTAR